jgi:hypothetical protein
MQNNDLYYINNDNNLSSILSQFGTFLETDYERLISNSLVPSKFKSRNPNSKRKIVIIGSDGTPALVAKSVFLALQLSGASTIDIKPSSLDEALIIENIIKNNNKYNIDTSVHVGTDPEVELSAGWRNILDNATDIIVYGDYQTVEYYKTLKNEYRQVYIHEDKVSFGIVRSDSLTDALIDNICFDFFNFYGFGSLAPKFYIFIGELDKKVISNISKVYSSVYGEQIEEFQSNLNFVKKTNLIKFITNEKVSRYINITKGINNFQIHNLFGDIKIYIAKTVDEANTLIDMLKNDVSTIAVDPSDKELASMVEFNMPPRMCDIGSMHSLHFWDSVDEQSDFDIFNDK